MVEDSNFFLFPRYNEEGSTVDAGLSGVQLMVVTVKLLRDPRLLLLLPLTVWMGVDQVFRGADYTSVSMIIGLLAVRIGFVWNYKCMEENTVCAYEKYLFIGISNMNGTSLCVKFKHLLYSFLL